jgi:Uma2 family endonuclease
MSSAPKVGKATLDDLAYLRDQGHADELIDGEIVYKAMPTAAHGSAQRKVGALIDPFDGRGGPRGPGGWWLMTEVEVLYAKTREVFRHDLVGFRRDLHPSRPSNELPVKARPDWACEILSPSTARYDVVQKQRTLHAHGVPHYWIIDPEHQTLTVMRRNEGHYLRVLDAGVGDVVRAEPFDAIELDVRELFGVEDDAP